MKDLEAQIAEAEQKAWVNLTRYKFLLFGYWAGVWVHLNRLRPKPLANPFVELVRQARKRMHAQTKEPA